MPENIKVGHVELTVDPEQISVEQMSYISAGMPLRGRAAQAIPTGYSDLQIKMSVIFPNVLDVNEKLRRLIALAKASPFTMLRSAHVADTIILGTDTTKRDSQSAEANYSVYYDQVLDEMARFVWAYYVIPQVKFNLPADRSIELLKDALKQTYGQTLSDESGMAKVDTDRSGEISRDIAARKWQWNYVLRVGKADGESHTEEEVLALLNKDVKQGGEISAAGIARVPRYSFTATVTHVWDGDTIRVKPIGDAKFNAPSYLEGQDIVLRMIGYDAFETVPAHWKSPTTADFYVDDADTALPPFPRGQESHSTDSDGNDWGLTCKAFLQEKVPDGTTVRVDGYALDQYDRLTAIVTANGELESLNHQILKLGYAFPYVVQEDEAAVDDVSLLQKAQEAADANAGVWGALWNGYHFRVSPRSTLPPYEATSEVRPLEPRDTKGVLLPSNFRRAAYPGKLGAVLGQRITTAEAGVNRNVGHAIGGENTTDPASDVYFDIVDFDTAPVRVLWWDFAGDAVERHNLNEIKAMLQAALRRAERTENIRQEGPIYVFRTLIDGLRTTAKRKNNPTAEGDAKLSTRHFADDYIPVCFNGIRITNMPSLPKALQATLTFSLFNHYPFTPIFGYMGADKNGIADRSLNEYDPARSVPFLQHLYDRYLTYDLSNRFTNRYIGIYTDKSADEITIELNSPRLMATLNEKKDASDEVKRIEERTWDTERTRGIIIGPKNETLRDLYSFVVDELHIQSVSIDYENNIPAIPIEGTEYPTAMFTGRGQGRAEIAFTTNSRESIRGLYMIKAVSQSAARTMAGRRLSNSSITLIHPLLNLTGMFGFVIDNIQETSDPERPGWFNIVVNLIESTWPKRKTEELRQIDIDQPDSLIDTKLVELVLDEIFLGDSPDAKAELIDKIVGPEDNEAIDKLFNIPHGFVLSKHLRGNHSPIILNLLPYLLVSDLHPPDNRGEINMKSSEFNYLRAALHEYLVDLNIDDLTHSISTCQRRAAEAADEIAEYKKRLQAPNLSSPDSFLDRASLKHAMGFHNRMETIVNKKEGELEQVNAAKSDDGRQQIIANLSKWYTDFDRDKEDITPYLRAALYIIARFVLFKDWQDPTNYNHRLLLIGPPQRDWLHKIHQALSSPSYGQFCDKSGQQRSGVVSSSIKVGGEEKEGIITIHPNWAQEAWWKGGEYYVALSNLTEYLRDSIDKDPVGMRKFLRFLLKLGLAFPSYKAYFMRVLVQHFPGLADQFDAAILRTGEPNLYKDLDLPSYSEIYGTTHVDDPIARLNIYQLGMLIMRKIGEGYFGTKNLLVQYHPMISNMPYKQWLDEFPVKIMGMSAPKIREEDPNSLSIVFIKDAILTGVQDLNDTEENYIRDAVCRFIQAVKSAKEQYEVTIRVPDSAKPRFRDLGVRGPHAYNVQAVARQDNDHLEPGWFYHRPPFAVSDKLEGMVDEDNDDIAFGLTPESPEDSWQKHGGWVGYGANDMVRIDRMRGYNRFDEQRDDLRNFKGNEKREKDKELAKQMQEDKAGAKRAEANPELKTTDIDITELAITEAEDSIELDSDAITNPIKSFVVGTAGSPAMQNARFGTRGEQNKMLKTALQTKPKYPYDMRFAFPTVALYFVEEDKEDWGFWDDYYYYESILSVEIVRSKNQTDLAIITVTNMSGLLTNSISPEDEAQIEGTVRETDDVTRVRSRTPSVDAAYEGRTGNPLDPHEDRLVAFNIKQGTRIMLKLGYSTKAQDLPVIFTGQVAEVMPGSIITLVCQAYDYQLHEPLVEKWGKAHHSFPEIIQDMLANTRYFGGYRFYADRLSSQTENRGTDAKGQDILSARNFLETSYGDNLYIDRAGWWGTFFRRIWGNDWYVNGSMMDNMYTMPRYWPNDVMAVRPYDGRATLFFGPPEGAIMTTSRAGSSLIMWESKRQQYANLMSSGKYKVLDGALSDNSKLFKSDTEVIEAVSEGGLEAGWKIGESSSRYALPNTDMSKPIFVREVLKYGDPNDDLFVDSPWGVDETVGNFYVSKGSKSIKAAIDAVPDDILIALLNDLAIYADSKGEIRQVLIGKYANNETGQKWGIDRFRTYNIDTDSETAYNDHMEEISAMSADGDAALSVAQALSSPVAGVSITSNRMDLSDSANIKSLLKRFVDIAYEIGSCNSIVVEGRLIGIPPVISSAAICKMAYRIGTGRTVWGKAMFEMQSLYIVAWLNLSLAARSSLLWRLLFAELLPFLTTLPDFVAKNPDEDISQAYMANKAVETNHLPPNMEPFRRHHIVVSGQNMISNQIKASRSHMGNIAVLESPAKDPTIKKGYVKMPSDTHIQRASVCHEDELTYPVPAYFYDINAYSNNEAWQVAMSCLGEALRETYQGQLVILGQPDIQPYDIVVLRDYQNMMFGSFEVKRATHHFSAETGYITTIEPHMIVHVNKDTDWWASLKASAILTAGTFAAAGLVALIPGAPLWVPMLLLGTGGAIASIGDLPSATFLGFNFPWISGQARLGPSRLNPVRLSPMSYKGVPYVAGLEGWAKYAYNNKDGAWKAWWDTASDKWKDSKLGFDTMTGNADKYFEAFGRTLSGIKTTASIVE